VQKKGERWWEAELYRLRGELRLKQNPSEPSEAQNSFERAIEVAGQQGANLLKLRAIVSLAQLLHGTNHREKTHAMLAETYGGFTEGLDTADLKQAKALLEKLDAK
jgi:predicted ATPase